MIMIFILTENCRYSEDNNHICRIFVFRSLSCLFTFTVTHNLYLQFHALCLCYDSTHYNHCGLWTQLLPVSGIHSVGTKGQLKTRKILNCILAVGFRIKIL
jgi:hypothetical protein